MIQDVILDVMNKKNQGFFLARFLNFLRIFFLHSIHLTMRKGVRDFFEFEREISSDQKKRREGDSNPRYK